MSDIEGITLQQIRENIAKLNKTDKSDEDIEGAFFVVGAFLSNLTKEEFDILNEKRKG